MDDFSRRQVVFALGSVAAAAAAKAAGAEPVGPTVPPGGGLRDQTEADTHRAGNAWLASRLREAESVRVGSTHADVAKLFQPDGGISPLDRHRFVLAVCPFIKIEVEFDDGRGGKARHPVPPSARVASVSKPYLERPIGD